jgi:hypothetical protein
MKPARSKVPIVTGYAGAPDRRKDVLNGMDRIAHHSVLNEMPRQQRAHADAGPA